MIPLPPSDLNVVGSARKKPEYNAAFEEYVAEVWNGIEHGHYLGPAAHLRVMFYVANVRPEDGRFRPEMAKTTAPVMDAIYEAVKRAGFVDSFGEIPLTTVGVWWVDDIKEEGIGISIEGMVFGGKSEPPCIEEIERPEVGEEA